MIVTELYNGQGLGNQLWCYITTRVIAKDRGYDFGIKSPEKFKGGDFLTLDFGKQVVGGDGPEGGPPQTLPLGIENYYAERKITHPLNGSDIRIYDEKLINIENNTKVDGSMQDEQYILHRKNEIKEWLKVKEEYEFYDFSNDNICIINFRGTGYVSDKDLFLTNTYWENAINNMRKINPNFKFIVITEDIKNAKKLFPHFDVFHFNIAKDYVVIKNAHYLILSNSSFAWFPAWLNENLKYCIAPKYWGRHNISDGYWSLGYNLTTGWMYQDREGILYDYDTCLKEWVDYIGCHTEYFSPIKIKGNFLVVSNHNNNVGWVNDYTDNFVIYDRSDNEKYLKDIDPEKIIKSPNVGFNLYDYFTFIIDHYDELPDCTIFTKGNIFTRHVRKDYFDRIINNSFFTPIEDHRVLSPAWPKGFLTSDGGFCEINKSRYMGRYKTKYFNNYDVFLRFCFINPVIPRYVRFAPGANYIVPKSNILKLPKIFYENLRTFISHAPLAGESYIVERALYTLWTSNFELNRNMLERVDETMTTIIPNDSIFKLKEIIPSQIIAIIPSPIKRMVIDFEKMTRTTFHKLLNTPLAKNVKRIVKKAMRVRRGLMELIGEWRAKRTWLSPSEIAEYRKGIKIYDAFPFFNELDLLEIRLNILNDSVDYFVIVEATETFSGYPKPLYFKENKERFKKWEHKIIHYVVDTVPKDENDLQNRLRDNKIDELEKQTIKYILASNTVGIGVVHWFKEFYIKESIKKALVHLDDNDICYVSDLDEIWNPNLLIDYSKDDVFKPKQIGYQYFLNNRTNENAWDGWTGTIVTKYKNIRNDSLTRLLTHRIMKSQYIFLRNGGWHFSFQGGYEGARRKIEESNHPWYKPKETLPNLKMRVARYEDHRGRSHIKLWKDERGLPNFLIANREKYKKFFR